ncbi:MAG: lipid kinase [Epulopiscium sp. Nele67-Bin005]|nr:MAG: lipid kinase [Epulopiscium sp. Nele67-Bin005]
MKQAILMYNPKAGQRQILTQLDYVAERMQSMGYQLNLYRSEAQGAIEKYIIDNITQQNTHLIIISGGDGTVNECINGIMKKKLNIPVSILPLGTANDFARTAGIPFEIKEALALIEEGNLQPVDIGKVNDEYFINVCNMGIFSGVSHEIDLEFKKNFGKLAYYMKGMEELQNYETMDIEITSDEGNLKGDYVFILIFNGKGAGGFNKLAKHASITDGLFDVVAIKNVGLSAVPRLLIKAIQGEHLEDNNVDYLQISSAKIECFNQHHKQFVTDLDGEVGPDFPLNIKVVTNKFQIYLPTATPDTTRKILKRN